MKTNEKENLIREYHNSEVLVRHNIFKALIENRGGKGIFYWEITEPWRNYVDVKLFSKIEISLEKEEIDEVRLEYVNDIICQNDDLTWEESEWWKEWVIDYWKNVAVDMSHNVFSGCGRIPNIKYPKNGRVPKRKYPKIILKQQLELNENIKQLSYKLNKWNLNVYLIRRQVPKLYWIWDRFGRLHSKSNYETFLKIKT